MARKTADPKALLRVADGQKILRPGVYAMSIEWYHQQCAEGPSVSSSGLRQIIEESPAHFWSESSLNPKRKPRKESRSFVLGRAAHHLLLGEASFTTLFIVRPETLAGRAWQGNRLDCKEWLAKQAKAGRTVLIGQDIESIRGMAHSLAAHPLVQHGILNGDVERSLIWQDAKTGIWLKSRPDVLPNASGDVADLKGTSDIGFDLDLSVSRYGYDVQAALTKWGMRAVLGLEMTSFSFVFCEFDAPHCVDVLTLHANDIADAEKDLRCAIDTFDYCRRTGDWFGPSGTQNDARFVYISERTKERRSLRRAFLEREIARDTNAEG